MNPSFKQIPKSTQSCTAIASEVITVIPANAKVIWASHLGVETSKSLNKTNKTQNTEISTAIKIADRTH